MTLGEQMIFYRAKNRINQTELAKRCGVTTQTIYNIENERQNPTKLTQAKIRLVIDKEENNED